jgi:hypothetical protein
VRLPGVTATRAGWALLLLAVPQVVLGPAPGRSTEAARVVLRMLGARQLLQAAVSLARPTPWVLALGATADGLHAASALGFAALDHRWRRRALLDAAVASAFCVATARSAHAR